MISNIDMRKYNMLVSAVKEYAYPHGLVVTIDSKYIPAGPVTFINVFTKNGINSKENWYSVQWNEVENILDTIRIVLARIEGDFRLKRKGAILEIKNVIFNNPATIVFWKDGTKTVVKCQEEDTYDPEKGLAMAITKKALGNKGNYCNELKKWLERYEPSDGPTVINSEIVCDKYREALDAWNEFIRIHGDNN